jgi:hypothetical protein
MASGNIPSPTKERIGINAVEAIFLNDFDWLFREQPVSDYGIDAQVEIVEDHLPTGKLIALQIKTGSSYFRKRGEDYVFYGEMRHLDYWTHHSLPVFLILHDPDKNVTLWQKIERRLAMLTESGWSITIPATSILTASSKSLFSEGIAADLPSIRRANMAMDYEVMLFIKDQKYVYFEVEDWVNKTLNVRGIKVFFDDYKKDEADWDIPIGAPTRGLDDLIYRYFPWLDYEHIETRDTASAEIEVHILRVRMSELGKSYPMVEDYFANGRPEPDEPEPSQLGSDDRLPDDR